MPLEPICPPTCRANPTYRKVNPADAPIMILALTSDVYNKGIDVRRRVDRAGAAHLANPGCRAGQRGRCFVARGSRGTESHADEQLRHLVCVESRTRCALPMRTSRSGQVANGTTTPTSLPTIR